MRDKGDAGSSPRSTASAYMYCAIERPEWQSGLEGVCSVEVSAEATPHLTLTLAKRSALTLTLGILDLLGLIGLI